MASQSPAHAPDKSPDSTVFVETIVVDKKGNVIDDLKATDFEVAVDGQPRRVVSAARLYRGPGAAEAADMRRKAVPADPRPRIEPRRALVLVIDQGSLLPGDEARARAVVENAVNLLGLEDRVGFMTLPDLAGSMPLDRDRFPAALGRLKGLRAVGGQAPTAEAEDPEKKQDRVEDVAPPAGGGERPGAPVARADNRATAPETLDDALSVGKSSSDTVSPAAAKQHAQAALSGLTRLIEALQQVPGGKTVVLLSAGLVADEVADDIGQASLAAASSNTRVYALQVPTPARRFAEAGQSGLKALAVACGGGLIPLKDKPGEALQRMVGELAFAYLLLLEPLPVIDPASPHSLVVTTQRKGATVRSNTWLRPGGAVPEAVPDPAPTSAKSGAPSGTEPTARATGEAPPAKPNPARETRTSTRDADLDRVLARTSDYVINYAREVSAVVAQEVYEQHVMGRIAGEEYMTLTPQQSRKLVSDFLLVQVPGGGWLPFRDVFEVDGQAVRERDNRLQQLFVTAPVDKAIQNAAKIWEESARYNIGPVRRNLNVPTLPLMFVTGENFARFTFNKAGEDDVGGMRTWVIEYREVAKPTIIRTSNGTNVPAAGRLWVEPTSGRIVRTTLEAGGATITVVYRPFRETPGVWMPATMEEEYGATIRAKATYSNIRRFRVYTEETIKK